MNSTTNKGSDESNSEDIQDTELVNHEKQESSQKEGNGKSENQRRFEEEMAAFDLIKPWPPLLMDRDDKPRSYSDTSQLRVMAKAIKGDVRSCTSYMHLPHISGQLKRIQELQGSSSSPHLHQSFSRMHLPHINDPWNPGEDFPTVSVIALAEERDRANTEDAITDKEEAEVKEDFGLSDEYDNEDCTDKCVKEHAIYSWNREMGRTRSLSDPVESSNKHSDGLELRPRALSMESAEKAKKPPSRIQFQMTLSELEEDHDEHAGESDGGEPSLEEDVDELDPNEQEDTKSVLVLAESSETVPDAESSEQTIPENDSSDEILTTWTRYDSKKRSATFSSELATIDENINDINYSLLPMGSGANSCPSVQNLVDEVAKDVLDRSSEKVASFGEQRENVSDSSSPDSNKQKLALPLASPLRKTEAEYATAIERKAFDKISKWKTKFASKLEDVLRKSVDFGDQQKSSKNVIVDVPMNLSEKELQDLKKNMIMELKKKANSMEAHDILSPQPVFRPATKCHHETGKLHKDLDAVDLFQRLQNLQSSHEKDADDPTSEEVSNASKKIAELFQWHDQERTLLRQEMKKLLATEEPSESLSDVNTDKVNMERLYKSFQVITDTIFNETISRLNSRGTEIKAIPDPDHFGARSSETLPSQQLFEKKAVKNATCQTSPPASRIPVPSKGKKSSKKTRLISDEDDYAYKNASSTSNGSIFTNHVHTISLAEHICHRDTCVGAEEETDPSYYTSECSAHSCECDFGSDERETTSEERITGETESDYYLRCGDELSHTPSTQTTVDTHSHSSTPKNESDDDGKERLRTSQDFGSDSEDESLYAQESDACSEIADLLGVYQVYNLGNDRDNEPSRPQAPEPMTYEEKDLREKVKSQKGQLKSYKRKLREFKIKNRRVKEQLRQLELQRNEWREDFLAKDNRINDLKREVEHLSLVMKKYKTALEKKSNIIKQKEQEIVTLQHSEKQSDNVWQFDHLQDLEKQLKEALNENKRLQLKLDKKSKEDESKFFREDTLLDLQVQLKSAHQRITELEQELRESKKSLLKLQAEKEIQASGCTNVEIENKQNFKQALNEKDQIIKELGIQQNNIVEELTEKICEIMTEKNCLIQKISDLTQQTSTSHDLESANSSLKEEITQLKKALEDAEVKLAQRPFEDGMSSEVFMSASAEEYGQTSSSDTGTESEITFLKTALEGYQMLTQRLIGNSKQVGQSFVYEEKLDAMVRSAHARCAQLETKLKDVVSAKEKESLRCQKMACQLKKANQKIQDMTLINGNTNKSFTVMQNKCQALEKENMELKKKQDSNANEKKRHSSVLIEITELQAKLAQRDLEIQELQQSLDYTQSKLRKSYETPSINFSDPSTSGFANFSFDNKKYASSDEYSVCWDEGSEMHRQYLIDASKKVPTGSDQENNPNVLKVMQDMQNIRQMLDNIVKGQEKREDSFQNDLENMLKEKTGELERQEALYKQIMKTKEKLFNEVIKEKTHLINMLTEAKNRRELSETSDAWEKKMKEIVEKEMIKRFNEFKSHIEGLLPKLCETLPAGVVADAFKMNESAIKRVEETTEENWSKVSKELADLKDFTFEMADAIEKDLYSSHDQILDFAQSASDDTMKCIRDEGYVTRKSVLDQLQATRKSRDTPHFDAFYATLDEFGKRNTRELRQARRDVLLAAEAVTNTADELHQLKASLETKLSVHDTLNKNDLSDELTRRMQLIEAQEEVKELRKTFSAAQITGQQEFTERSDPLDSVLMKELQERNLASTERETREQELDKLRHNILHNSFSSGEISGVNRFEDDHKRSFGSVGNTTPSRDYVTLRERLDRRAKERLSDGLYQEPSTSSASPSLAWARDTSSSIKDGYYEKK